MDNVFERRLFVVVEVAVEAGVTGVEDPPPEIVTAAGAFFCRALLNDFASTSFRAAFKGFTIGFTDLRTDFPEVTIGWKHSIVTHSNRELIIQAIEDIFVLQRRDLLVGFDLPQCSEQIGPLERGPSKWAFVCSAQDRYQCPSELYLSDRSETEEISYNHVEFCSLSEATYERT